MAVWLAHGPCTVGLEGGVLRAGDFARLVSAAEAADTICAERDRLLQLAREQADAMLAEARARAGDLLAHAQARFDEAQRRGREQGLRDAAAQWTAQALDAAEATRRGLVRQSDRLSAIVSLAIERVIEQEDRAALFRRSLRTITKLLRDAPMLTLRVPEGDRDSAQRAVDSVTAEMSTTLPIEIVADAAMPVGACRFESDRGVIDAGLDTQLAAIRRAVSRAAHQVAQDVDAGVDAAGEAQDEGDFDEEATDATEAQV